MSEKIRKFVVAKDKKQPFKNPVPMGKTAENMNHKQALKMSSAISSLIELSDPERYCVAITRRFPELEEKDPEYSVHLYLRDPKKSGYLTLAILAHAIEQLGAHVVASESTYDAGTRKGNDIRKSVMIW